MSTLPPLVRPADLRLYRGPTVALLSRYCRLSIEVGRLPSLLGREFFRSSLSDCHVQSFEDSVILVHDVERILERLDPFSRSLVARIVFERYTYEEASPLLQCARITIARRFPQTLDRLSDMFLAGGYLQPLLIPAGEPGGDDNESWIQLLGYPEGSQAAL